MKNPFIIDHLTRTLRFQTPTIGIPERNQVPHADLDPDPLRSLGDAEMRFDASQIQRGTSLLTTGKDPQTGGDHQAINKAAHEYPGLVKKEQEFFKPTPITTFQRYLPDFLKRK